MLIPCPKCGRSFEGVVPADPDMMIRCRLCASMFTQEEMRNPSQAAQQSTSPEDSQEEWEFEADDFDPPSPEDLLGDIDDGEDDLHEDFPPTHVDDALGFAAAQLPQEESIPDLPESPPSPLFHQIADGIHFDSSVDDSAAELPELPELQELEEAPAKRQAPQQKEAHPTPKIRERLASSSSTQQDSAGPELDELLMRLQEDRPAKVGRRYVLRRKDKIFGPFDEEEIQGLIERRKLLGDEETALEGQNNWKPLDEWDDFRPLLQAMKSKSFRVGWEGRKRKKPKSPPPEKVQPTPEVEETPPPPTPSSPPFALIGGLILAILLAFGGWYMMSSKKNTKRPQTQCRPNQKVLMKTLVLNDSFDGYMKLLGRIKALHAKGKQRQCWGRIRYIYQLLDSHGDDEKIRAAAAPIIADFEKKSTNPLLIKKAQLSKAISKRDRKEIRKLIGRFKKWSLKMDHEWLYLQARAYELIGDDEQSLTLYKQLTKQQPKHIRARLGLYRYQRDHHQFKQSNRLLAGILKQNPLHLPALLYAKQDAIYLNFWKKQRKSIEERMDKLFEAGKTTTALLAKRSFLEAQQLWRQKQTNKALLQIDKAIRLSSQNEDYRWKRIEYYVADRQYTLVEQFLKQEQKDGDYPVARLWLWHIKMLIEQKELTRAEKQINQMKKQGIFSPERRYTFHHVRGALFEAKQNLKRALREYQFAQQTSKKHKEIALALARIHHKQQDNKTCQTLLNTFLKQALPGSKEYKAAKRLLQTCK